MKDKTILRILNNYIEPDDDCGNYCMESFEYQCETSLLSDISDFSDCGVSKGAIKFKGSNDVYKIPFTGSYEYTGEEYFFGFCNAGVATNDNENSWNYCEAELNVYISAYNCELERFFAEIQYVGEVNSIPIYKQTFVHLYDYEMFDCFDEDSLSNSNKKISSQGFDTGYNKCFDVWCNLAIDYYGEEAVYDLLSFLTNHDLLEDMHRGNFGYVIDGSKKERPILLDYSGYWE